MTMHENGRLGPIEWATAGRQLPGEHVSGDQPIAVGIDEEAALFGVIDGLGHGPDAATAAIRAVEVLKGARSERLEVLVLLLPELLKKMSLDPSGRNEDCMSCPDGRHVKNSGRMKLKKALAV